MALQLVEKKKKKNIQIVWKNLFIFINTCEEEKKNIIALFHAQKKIKNVEIHVMFRLILFRQYLDKHYH